MNNYQKETLNFVADQMMGEVQGLNHDKVDHDTLEAKDRAGIDWSKDNLFDVIGRPDLKEQAFEEHECFEAQEHIKNCPRCRRKKILKSGKSLEEEVSQMHRMDMQDYQEEVKANMDYE